ncbi:MAG: polyphenol oxidase family protein [Actinobacteria bacterium]|nr:polyphenol oxidase family protein [Actinomycetota bacterium]
MAIADPDGPAHLSERNMACVGDAVVCFTTTTRADGDLGVDVDRAALQRRRDAVTGLPWAWLRQVHGADVLTVRSDGLETRRGAVADALVTDQAGIALAVHTADCAPVVLYSPSGVIGVAHAGWRGLEAGIIENVVAAMESLGAADIAASIGPCIHHECYEFGPPELGRVAKKYGPEVRRQTASGAPALDLPGAVRAALLGAGVRSGRSGPCTACRADDYFSHRARREDGRMATVVWREQ